MFAWIENNMEALVTNFNDDFRAEIQLERANPTHQPDTITTGPTGPAARPSAKNHVIFPETQQKK
jgi:hypothetical protein